MSVTHTLTALESFCRNSSGNHNQWSGNSGQYQWTIGRESTNNITNGVIRKYVGTNDNGDKIWVVAGSFKIQDTGEILRFTGLPKKVQAVIQAITVTPSIQQVILR